MLYLTTCISLVDKPRMIQSSNVLTYGLLIPLQRLDDVLLSNLWTPSNKQQYLDAMMIGNTFKMSLKLLCAFYFFLGHTLDTRTYPSMCGCLNLSILGEPLGFLANEKLRCALWLGHEGFHRALHAH